MKKKICKNIDPHYFDKIWNFYESKFPFEERRTLKKYLQALSDSRFNPYIYQSEQRGLLALAFYWEFDDFIYLEHFAVNSEVQSQGIGSKIIKDLIDVRKPVILEIECPIDELTNRRLCFYKHNQFTRTGYNFKQIKYHSNDPDLILELLSTQPISSALYNTFKNTIYQELSPYCE